VLQSAFDLHQTYKRKIRLCDEQIIAQLARPPARVDLKDKPVPPPKPGRPRLKDRVAGTNLREERYRSAGLDLTAIASVGVLTAQVVISEIGLDMTRWRSKKHFASWLGLGPDNRISGGKVFSTHARHVANSAADAPRIAATSLQNSQTALGAFYRRLRAKRGAASAITATAHKLARIIYRLLK
jgi:transposase